MRRSRSREQKYRNAIALAYAPKSPFLPHAPQDAVLIGLKAGNAKFGELQFLEPCFIIRKDNDPGTR